MSWLKTNQYFEWKIVQVEFHSQLPNFILSFALF